MNGLVLKYTRFDTPPGGNTWDWRVQSGQEAISQFYFYTRRTTVYRQPVRGNVGVCLDYEPTKNIKNDTQSQYKKRHTIAIAVIKQGIGRHETNPRLMIYSQILSQRRIQPNAAHAACRTATVTITLPISYFSSDVAEV